MQVEMKNVIKSMYTLSYFKVKDVSTDRQIDRSSFRMEIFVKRPLR